MVTLIAFAARVTCNSSGNENYFGESLCNDDLCPREDKGPHIELYLWVRMSLYAAIVFTILMYYLVQYLRMEIALRNMQL